ncbi:M42 family metallopeptidase [Ruminococcus flavefaciens]|uniref:M42 family metallopeptidase n=1 Tax=Ruminococcus flavefaciens TaxID=1265 RepID=UPI0026F24C54|nr:M42 family metallopeptidase [Ruminococcus flavefaciens]
MKELLKELCLTDGVSGDESAVRDLIISRIKDVCEYRVDNLGSIICFKKGRKAPDKKLMICAHMDEVGFMITYIRPDGTLSFGNVGGIDPSVVIGRQVRVGRSRISGVVGSTAVHNLSKEQREKAPKTDSLYIDIGAADKAEAEKYVSLGDCAYFDSEFTELGERRIKSKALDDRAGCAMMIELLHEELEYDTYFVFNVQEEIGLRGSTASSFAVAPDYAIVLEATTAADIDGAAGAKRVCELGGGPVVSFMDRHTIYDKELYRLAFDIAKENGFPCQTKTMIAGGNDAGAIHISGKGVRTIAVSLPCRYLHSPSSVIEYADMENSYKLVKSLIGRIHET